MSMLPTEKLIVTIEVLLPHLPFGKSTLKRKIKAGAFPKPFKLGGLNAWRIEQVQAWFDALGKEDNHES